MSFAAGQHLTASLLNNALGVLAEDTQLTAGTTTSTSYVTALTAGTTCGKGFVAPTSGIVCVLFYSKLRNSTTNVSLVSFRIGTGLTVDAGAEILATSDDRVIQHFGTADEAASAHHVHTGLTPGSAYNVVLRHRVLGATTGTFTSRKISVLAIPA